MILTHTSMKKIMNLAFLLLSLPVFLFSQNISIGGGLVLGSGFSYKTDALSGSSGDSYESSNFGVFVNSGYEFGRTPVKINLSYLYTLPSRYDGSIADVDYRHTINSGMADLNVNYSVLEGGLADIYGIGGLNLHFVGYKYSENYTDNDTGEEETFVTKQSDNSIGLNIGAGAFSRIGENISLFAEAKYIISYYGQFVLSVGIVFDI